VRSPSPPTAAFARSELAESLAPLGSVPFTASPSLFAAPEKSSSGGHVGVILGAVLGPAAVAAAVVAALLFRRRNTHAPEDSKHGLSDCEAEFIGDVLEGYDFTQIDENGERRDRQPTPLNHSLLEDDLL
jgi:hypothetical protein